MIELNTITPLSNGYGIHGGYVKVVGTSFRNKPSDLPRHVTIRGFFEKAPSTSTYSSSLKNLCEDIDIRVIQEIKDVQQDINQYIKVEKESNNLYDINAIAVYVKFYGQFTKIGYLPKDLSELIATNEFKYYLVGFEKSGRGIMLTMVFSSSNISIFEMDPESVEPEKNENLGFISLSKIRKKLCTR